MTFSFCAIFDYHWLSLFRISVIVASLEFLVTYSCGVSEQLESGFCVDNFFFNVNGGFVKIKRR